MQKWESLAQLECAQPKVAETVFQSHGDWFCEVHRIPKHMIDREGAVGEIKESYGLDDEMLER